MMVHDFSHPLLSRLSFLRILTFYKLIQTESQDIKLPTRVHSEDSGQAARANGGGVHYETREHLHRQDDLICWTKPGVDKFTVRRTW